jgi:hypothetical protein
MKAHVTLSPQILCDQDYTYCMVKKEPCECDIRSLLHMKMLKSTLARLVFCYLIFLVILRVFSNIL